MRHLKLSFRMMKQKQVMLREKETGIERRKMDTHIRACTSDNFIHLARYSRRSKLEYAYTHIRQLEMKIYLRKLRVAQQEDINTNFNVIDTMKLDRGNFLG